MNGRQWKYLAENGRGGRVNDDASYRGGVNGDDGAAPVIVTQRVLG